MRMTHKHAVELALNDPATRAARAKDPHVIQRGSYTLKVLLECWRILLRRGFQSRAQAN